MIGLKFTVDMPARFLDRKIAAHLSPQKRRFLMRAGGAIRTTARRLLRKARRTRPSELSDAARRSYEWKKRLFDAGLGPEPVLPDKISEPGKPPLLHMKPSMLKERLFFALDEDGESVVIGPEKLNSPGDLEGLERSRPFMRPAFDRIEPRLATYWPK